MPEALRAARDVRGPRTGDAVADAPRTETLRRPHSRSSASREPPEEPGRRLVACRSTEDQGRRRRSSRRGRRSNPPGSGPTSSSRRSRRPRRSRRTRSPWPATCGRRCTARTPSSAPAASSCCTTRRASPRGTATSASSASPRRRSRRRSAPTRSSPRSTWSWLTDALDARGAKYTAASGTATTIVSTGFGELAEQGTGAKIELRASWTPTDLDLAAHVEGWVELLCMLAGLPPAAEGVSVLSARRAGRD